MVILSLKLPWISRLIWTCRLAVFRKVGMPTERGGFPRLGPAGGYTHNLSPKLVPIYPHGEGKRKREGWGSFVSK